MFDTIHSDIKNGRNTFYGVSEDSDSDMNGLGRILTVTVGG